MENPFPQIELRHLCSKFQVTTIYFEMIPTSVCVCVVVAPSVLLPQCNGMKTLERVVLCATEEKKKNEITCFGSKQAFHPFISNSTRCMMMKWHAQRHDKFSLLLSRSVEKENEEERFLPWVSEATPTRNKAKAATSTRQRAMKKEKERISLSLSWKIVLVRFELGGWACLNKVFRKEKINILSTACTKLGDVIHKLNIRDQTHKTRYY